MEVGIITDEGQLVTTRDCNNARSARPQIVDERPDGRRRGDEAKAEKHRRGESRTKRYRGVQIYVRNSPLCDGVLLIEWVSFSARKLLGGLRLAEVDKMTNLRTMRANNRP